MYLLERFISPVQNADKCAYFLILLKTTYFKLMIYTNEVKGSTLNWWSHG